MKHLVMEKTVPAPADEIYKKLTNFSSFEKHCNSVISVSVDSLSDNQAESSWRVYFHDGEMLWKEKDHFVPDEKKILFEQTEGDLDIFRGFWKVEETDSHQSKVYFEAEFCLGIPTLDDILNPIAEEAIKHNVNQMLHDLFMADDL
ncbi:type II toxin-antitoxin system RatA family toxin [Photobacterium leiognathi]|uniref:type II toxin-antitoxin system RatA family toxin n=1 Tax=Photobacterium leiognathi TaxID=553611 RepID=UPI0029812BAD|nr:SRPBCC family protein [Photobacterium leiognathi]